MPHLVQRQAIRTGEVSQLCASILNKLRYALGKDPDAADKHDWFYATALAVRDLIVDRWTDAHGSASAKDKTVNYLSIEYLIGRLLCDALVNLDRLWPMRQALAELGLDLTELSRLEPDAGLGSGGLGRLAACFMDSMATLGIPAYGYGIRYRLGLFEQHISNGWQHELPDDWLALGNPWEFPRTNIVYPIRFGGVVEYIGGQDEDTARGHWYPAETLNAMAYDTPIVGWHGRLVNTLRLWSARVSDPIRLSISEHGDHAEAMMERKKVELICQQLYPEDATLAGQELRLRQEYFFTSASLQDVIARHLSKHTTLDTLPDCQAIQLNDTHPAIAAAELMRLLVDEHEYSWSRAWQITRGTLNYTNHTLLPEALESWPVALVNRLLPRHMQLIYLINHLHLKEAGQSGIVSPDLTSAISLIAEGEDKRVRMGHLAFIGSRRINGVSKLHTQLMRQTTFRELDTALPGRIVNKTNGVSLRRWLVGANPKLTSLLTDTIGVSFLDDASALREAERFIDDSDFVDRFRQTRRQNKVAAAGLIGELTGIWPDPAALFDVHIKRIHEYKRQLLNILETVALYDRMRTQPDAGWTPRVKIFAGKAASSYARAKLIIKLVHDVARVVNSDPVVAKLLKVVFLPNYSVSLAECIIPAADVSEQISTAGMEASGTGNMKLALNGALTIGTLDGANVEIREHVGADNIYIFGLTAEEVADRRSQGFTGAMAAAKSLLLRGALDNIASGVFSPDDPDRYKELVASLLGYDHFMVAADFEAYWETQRKIDAAWKDQARWWARSIQNMARAGWFSSDRTIRGYARDIWDVPVKVH